MPRTITVKGVGKATTKPDLVVLSMSLESKDMDYEKAMEIAADNIAKLNKSLEEVDFEKSAIKTTNFNLRTDYESVRSKDGNYRQVFRGYVVIHDLKVEFDFDSDRLTRALAAVSSCPARPRLSVAFTVKDTSAINEEMLHSATQNARRKAEILCAASGVELCSLLSINYSWGELNIYSKTGYAFESDGLMAAPMAARANIEIEPDEIKNSDTVTFVWEIK